MNGGPTPFNVGDAYMPPGHSDDPPRPGPPGSGHVAVAALKVLGRKILARASRVEKDRDARLPVYCTL